MTFEVVLTDNAVLTYESVFEQIKDNFGVSAAAKFEQKTFQTLKLLSNTPLMFKETAENPGVRKGFIHANCSFFYTVDDTSVYILYFWDNRQQPLLQ